MYLARPEVAWSALASRWDTAGAGWNDVIAGRLAGLAGLAPGMVTADMGCGTGAVAMAAAPVIHPARVMGIDFSAAMVIQAKARADGAAIPNAIFWCEDVTCPSLQPGSLDAVLSSMAVAYLPRPAMALHAWRDLLRPGGILGFSWVLADDQKLRPAYDAVDAFLAPAHRWSAYERRWAVPEAVAMLPPGIDVSAVTETMRTRYESAEHWWRSSLTQEPAVAWSQIPFDVRHEVRHSAFEILGGLAAADGSLERVRDVCYLVARVP
jgi:ubiquinone/menaquinone biosynthesis C-methylase UbiE